MNKVDVLNFIIFSLLMIGVSTFIFIYTLYFAIKRIARPYLREQTDIMKANFFNPIGALSTQKFLVLHLFATPANFPTIKELRLWLAVCRFLFAIVFCLGLFLLMCFYIDVR